MAARSDQGVFNMNGNPELNVDLQYLAFTKSQWNHRILWRAFGIGYHDGRTGLTKTDNRPLAVGQADHKKFAWERMAAIFWRLCRRARETLISCSGERCRTATGASRTSTRARCR